MTLLRGTYQSPSRAQSPFTSVLGMHESLLTLVRQDREVSPAPSVIIFFLERRRKRHLSASTFRLGYLLQFSPARSFHRFLRLFQHFLVFFHQLELPGFSIFGYSPIPLISIERSQHHQRYSQHSGVSDHTGHPLAAGRVPWVSKSLYLRSFITAEIKARDLHR